MKVTEKKLANGKIQLDAVASTGDVSKAFEMAQYGFAQQMGIRGERGKTVEQLAREQLGIRDLDSVVQAQAVECLVPFALDKRNIVPAYQPTPKTQGTLRRGQTFSFRLEVTPKPEYELTSYEPVTITVPALTIEESEIDAQVEQLAQNYLTFEPVDSHPLGDGDSCKIAMDASQNGEPLKNLSTKGRTYVMGERLMPKSFEDQIYGMEEGDTKAFSFALDPVKADEEPDVIDCTVTILQVLKKVVPEVTDEWVHKTIGTCKTVEELRESYRRSLTEQRRAEHEDMKLAAASSELSKRFDGRIEDAVYEAMQKTYLENLRSQVEQSGMKFDDFVQQQGGQQQFSMMLMMQVRSNLVQGYSLDALYRHENLKVTDADLVEAASHLNPQNPRLAVQEMQEGGQGFVLREMAQRMKANKYLLAHATVIEA